jgi:hypothetical protein
MQTLFSMLLKLHFFDNFDLVSSQIASTAAYWIIFRLLALFPNVEILRTFSAVIAAFAVTGMHFTGMAAAKHVIIDGEKGGVVGRKYDINHTISREDAFAGAIVASAMLLSGVVLLSIADLRAWFYDHTATLREIELIVNQLEKMPNHTAAYGNFLQKYRSIVAKDTSVLTKGSESQSKSINEGKGKRSQSQCSQIFRKRIQIFCQTTSTDLIATMLPQGSLTPSRWNSTNPNPDPNPNNDPNPNPDPNPDPNPNLTW